MLFVPLPLFATLTLCVLLAKFLRTRDMRILAHRLFAVLLGLYALQSLLISLRWGYDVAAVAFFIALLAPVLPVCAYFAYTALSKRQTTRDLWPLGVVSLNWTISSAVPYVADFVILLTYLGFGGLLLALSFKGVDSLPRSPINNGREILLAMRLTGLALVTSGLTDIYLIVDFLRNDGQNAGLVVTFAQTVFASAIGISAIFGRSAQNSDTEPEVQAAKPIHPTAIDSEIVARLDQLFVEDQLHKDEDLSLRRLSRRLGLSDRQVSNAINRVRNLSVSQFVNEYRIKEACDLLARTDLSILNVSLSSGFASKSNFNREFLRVTGVTPSLWRQDKKPEHGQP